MFSNVWSENTALFERLMEIHSISPKLYYGFKRSDYANLCMSPSLGGTLPEYVISQEDNSPLTLYIDFHFFFFFSWISIVLLIKFIHKCMHIHLSPNIPKYIKEEGTYIFMKSKIS